MQICKIAYDSAPAADNMAIDSTMLEFGAATGQCMWRSYGWTGPSVTFGYSQKWAWIQANLAGFEGACVRRITGGGIVDHRHDLTYALSIPPNHPLHRMPALDLYKEVHTQIAEIIMDNGIPAELAPCRDSCAEGADKMPGGVCFQAPEPYDVIKPGTTIKLAGAAMKRNQQGVLIQGSLAMLPMPGLDPRSFVSGFGKSLASLMQARPIEFMGNLPVESLLRERQRFSSSDWNQRR